MSDERVRGHVRESADGLRGRDKDAEKARLREAQQQVAEEAQHRRQQRAEESDGNVDR